LQKQAFHGSPQLSSRFSVVLHGSLLFFQLVDAILRCPEAWCYKPDFQVGFSKGWGHCGWLWVKKGRGAEAIWLLPRKEKVINWSMFEIPSFCQLLNNDELISILLHFSLRLEKDNLKLDVSHMAYTQRSHDVFA